ncbi:MAG: arginine--tRNA ligase, partial [Euryarchaeota archaeon CG_4_9_14_3_um_filter_38_12]
AKPGFINFKIALPYLQQKILEIIDAGDSCGNSDLGKDLKINVEFISANPTGPLTLGNGRGGYAGDSLANVLRAFGAEVEREYYINDR